MKPDVTQSRQILIAPSLLACDFSRLKEEIADVERGGCDWLHVDVMDGHFVPNLTIGPVVVRSIRQCTSLPLDIHLMIDEPIRYIDVFRSAGADWLTVHFEACQNLRETLNQIRKSGAKPGISLRPKTGIEGILSFLNEVNLVLVMTVEPGFGGQAFMPEMLEKVWRIRHQFSGKISVDGGIDPNAAREAVAAGADVLVAGTSIFGQRDRREAIQSLRSSGKRPS